MKKFFVIPLFIFAAIIAGCNKYDEPSPDKKDSDRLLVDGAIIIDNHPKVTIEGRDADLWENAQNSKSISSKSSIISLSNETNELIANHYRFKEVAEMGTLTLEDSDGAMRTVQASHVKISDEYAFVTYNYKGDKNVGGLVIYKYSVIPDAFEEAKVSVTVHTSIKLPNAQLNALDFDGTHLYLAGASEDPRFGYKDDLNRAFFVVMEVYQDKTFKIQEPFYKHLTSHQATSIRKRGNRIYIATGDGIDGDGGLYIYNATTLEEENSILGIQHARSVDADETGVYLMQANPARVTHYNADGKGGKGEIYNKAGVAMQKDAKSDMLIWEQYLFVSGNESGMDMAFKNTGAVNQSLEAPNKNAGCVGESMNCWNSEEDVTNSVSMNSDSKITYDGESKVKSDLLFLANGRQGIYWYEIMKDENGDDKIVAPYDNSGLAARGSCNYIASSGNIIFIANGLGGLNVLYYAISPYEEVIDPGTEPEPEPEPNPEPEPEKVVVIGKWSTAKDGTKDVMGATGWMSSDHPDQDWQNYLYDKVGSNLNFLTVSRYGANNGDHQSLTMNAPRIPKGASRIFLHMKDCGEFTTIPGTTGYKDQDEVFLNYAFGIPKNQSGPATNYLVDDMLIKIGLQPASGYKGTANSGNANGFHAYNDYDWNLIATKVTANGGVIEFGWSFYPGRAQSGPDGSFWMLRDIASPAGEIVAGGVLAQGKIANGIAKIPLPNDGRKYVLVIGMMNIGEYYAPQTEGNPHLILSDVIQKW